MYDNLKLTICTQDVQTENIQSSAFGQGFSSYWDGDFMDKLQQKAVAFLQLIDYQYVIKLGRKGQIHNFVIDFQKQDFFHLIGLQKLTDLNFLKRSSVHIFNSCLKGKLTYSMLQKSEYFDDLGYRFDYFHLLEKILDDNELVFKCNINSMRVYSNIIADYMLQNFRDDLTFYIFTEKRTNADTQFCKSFFENSINDYTKGQTKMTLLYKEKVNKKTGESIVQYDRLSDNIKEGL